VVSTRQVILVVLATIVIFATGVMTGGLLVKKTMPVPPAAEPFLNRFEVAHRAVNQLDLAPEQRLRVHRIIRDKQELIADYFKILEPDLQDVFKQMRKQIFEELTPPQRQRLEELMKQRPIRNLPNRPDFRPGPFPPLNSDGGKPPLNPNQRPPVPPGPNGPRRFRPDGAGPRQPAPDPPPNPAGNP
jgi:hypothetical protein